MRLSADALTTRLNLGCGHCQGRSAADWRRARLRRVSTAAWWSAPTPWGQGPPSCGSGAIRQRRCLRCCVPGSRDHADPIGARRSAKWKATRTNERCERTIAQRTIAHQGSPIACRNHVRRDRLTPTWRQANGDNECGSLRAKASIGGDATSLFVGLTPYVFWDLVAETRALRSTLNVQPAREDRR